MRIAALRNRRNFEFFANLSRQVLQAVYRQIDLSRGQRLLDLLDEHPLGADLCESNIRDLVSGRLDDLNLDLMPALLKKFPDVIGLP